MFENLLNRLLRGEIQRQIRASLAVAENENSFLVGARSRGADPRERFSYERTEILEDALEAWRANPLARRIVALTSQYVVGGGLRIQCDHAATQQFLMAFWEHPLNQMPARIYEWCDELTRSGELFIALATGADGMSYARAIPAVNITAVYARENDVQQETGYTEALSGREGADGQAAAVGPDGPLQGACAERAWAGRNAWLERAEDGSFVPVLLHYAVNRPVGTLRGESDLAPLLRWLKRYAGWLEDRARLNRYRNSFLFVVKSKFASEAERSARQAALSVVPPSPGSILVVDESESWDVLSPKLESQDAGEDGLALKKMIAAGAGLPLHFLAEPGSATRTTAESAGGPTFRHFEQRQEFFCWMIADLLKVALARRALVDPRLDAGVKVRVMGADLSRRDNTALAQSAATVIAAWGQLRDRGLVDDQELARMAYKFVGEKSGDEG